MPIYEFLCRDCETRFDDLVSSDDLSSSTCSECRSADVVRIYSPFAVGAKSGGDPVPAMAGGACMPGAAGRAGGGGCCGGGCGGCG